MTDQEKVFKIPLCNKKREIVDYAIVDENDYEDLMKTHWSVDKKGYVKGYVRSTKRMTSMHQYLINKYHIPKKDVIDHLDRNKLNHKMSNLRIATYSQNSQNKTKKEDSLSGYIGVELSYNGKWRTSISIDGKHVTYSFDSKDAAAYCYDMLAIGKHGYGANINGISKPENFELPVKRKTAGEGSVYKSYGKYNAKLTYNKVEYNLGQFDSENDARNTIKNKKEEFKIQELEELYSRKITKTESGLAKIDIYSKDENHEILVDDGKWHELMQYTWCMSNGYVIRSTDGLMMHRYLMNAEDGEFIDHINNIPKDNRVSNLRKASCKQNSYNKSKTSSITTSKYKGVYKSNNFSKWRMIVCKEDVCYSYNFEVEEYAAYAYDIFAKELFQEYAKLNGIEKPENFVLPDKKKLHKYKCTGIATIKYKGGTIVYTATVQYKKKSYISTHNSIEDAVNWRNEKSEELHGRYSIPIEISDFNNIENTISYSKQITSKNIHPGITEKNINGKTVYRTRVSYIKDGKKKELAKTFEILEDAINWRNKNAKELQGIKVNIIQSNPLENKTNESKIIHTGISMNNYTNGSINYTARIRSRIIGKHFCRAFKTLEEAVKWRNEKAKELQGDKANLIEL